MDTDLLILSTSTMTVNFPTSRIQFLQGYFFLFTHIFIKGLSAASSCNRRQSIDVIKAITLQAVGVGEKLLNPSWDIGKTACVFWLHEA